MTLWIVASPGYLRRPFGCRLDVWTSACLRQCDRTGSRSFVTRMLNAALYMNHITSYSTAYIPWKHFSSPPYQPSDVTSLYFLLRGPLISYIDYKGVCRHSHASGVMWQMQGRNWSSPATISTYNRTYKHIAPNYAAHHTCFNERHHISVVKQKTLEVW